MTSNPLCTCGHEEKHHYGYSLKSKCRIPECRCSDFTAAKEKVSPPVEKEDTKPSIEWEDDFTIKYRDITAPMSEYAPESQEALFVWLHGYISQLLKEEREAARQEEWSKNHQKMLEEVSAAFDAGAAGERETTQD